MKTALCVFIAIVLAGLTLQYVHAQQPSAADIPVKHRSLPWPTSVSASARLVTVRPVTRGFEFIFQELNGIVHIVYMPDANAVL
ncbi:MAG: hypothetical protein ACT4P5_09875, partial [Armatimonadota bacterium]